MVVGSTSFSVTTSVDASSSTGGMVEVTDSSDLVAGNIVVASYTVGRVDSSEASPPNVVEDTVVVSSLSFKEVVSVDASSAAEVDVPGTVVDDTDSCVVSSEMGFEVVVMSSGISVSDFVGMAVEEVDSGIRFSSNVVSSDETPSSGEVETTVVVDS